MVVVLDVKVTATLETGVAQEVAEAVAVDVDTVVVELDVGVVPPEPTILMSAHVRYTCGV